MRKPQIAALTAATLVVVGGYYGLADALDLVPGPVTVASQDVRPNGFPTVAAADATVPTSAGLSPDAPVPSGSALTTYVAGLTSDPALSGATVGASVVDVSTGDELLASSASTALTPASSTKLLTAWAALSLLGSGHTLSTSTVLDGSTVTLVGGGDVLLADDAGDPDATVGHAGVGDLARATAEKLKAQGVASVTVRLDDTLFTGPTWNDGWESGNESYVAKIQPIMLDVTAHEASGDYPADPALEAAQVFATHLGEAGVTVTGDVSRAAAASGATELAVVRSAPLEDVLSVSLKASDNTMTEVEGHLVAVAAGETADFQGAARAVLAQLGKDGFDTSGVTLLDSSGLAMGNKIPARLFTQILTRAAGDDGGTAGRTLLADLPVAALDGTLDARLTDTAAAGTVRAKTGSLDQVSSLSGVVTTADGRLVAFAVIIDGFPSGGLWGARVALDNHFVVPLAACGCS